MQVRVEGMCPVLIEFQPPRQVSTPRRFCCIIQIARVLMIMLADILEFVNVVANERLCWKRHAMLVVLHRVLLIVCVPSSQIFRVLTNS